MCWVSMPVSVGQRVAAHPQRHDDLFQRRVAGPLADAVDRASPPAARRPAPPARLLATARPRSLWQWAEKITVSAPGTFSIRSRNISAYSVGIGVADRVRQVDGPGAGADRRLDAAAQEVALGAGGVLRRPFHVAAEVAGVGDRAGDRRPARPPAVMRRMWSRCCGLVEMKVWMRPRLAGRIASAQRSMSAMPARARPQTVLSVTISAILRTASKSPLEAIGKPASITSTPISSRILASSSFSSSDIEAPGDCSPSRMVVSKMMTRPDLLSVEGMSVMEGSLFSGRAWKGVRTRPLNARPLDARRRSGATKAPERRRQICERVTHAPAYALQPRPWQENFLPIDPKCGSRGPAPAAPPRGPLR